MEEIHQIAKGLQVDALRELSCTELHVLLSALNRIVAPLSDEEAFTGFYLKAVAMIENCRNRNRRTLVKE